MSISKTHYLSLTTDELLLLDGNCKPKTQELIDTVKTEAKIAAAVDAPDEVATVIARIVASVDRKFSLRVRRSWAKEGFVSSHCSCCRKTPGYFTYARSGRYAVKGQPNKSRPKSWNMTSYNEVSLCPDCQEIAKAPLKIALEGILAQIPVSMGGNHHYEVHPMAHCNECDWDGHEGQMLKSRTMDGQGTYPSSCPSCKAKNSLFGRTIIETNHRSYVLVDASGKILREHIELPAA